MTDATPEQIVAFLTGGRPMTDSVERWKLTVALREAEIERLTSERDEWRERYEAEHRDHLATIKHADALEDECHKLERE